MTPSSLGRRYAPFIALAAVQLLLVAVVPSKAPERADQVAAGTRDGSDDGRGAGTGGRRNRGTGRGGTGGFGDTGAGKGGTPTAGTPTGGPGTGTGAGTGRNGGGGRGASAQGDMSNCDENGRQIGPTYYMPECRPVWPEGADNGGATMTGVDEEEIRFVFYVSDSDPQVDALLASQNLAATRQDRCLALEAFTKELNKRWETYGRTFVSLDGPANHKGSAQQDCDFPYYQGACTLTPPDPPCNRAEARQIAAMEPAYVMAPVANEAFYNELGKLGIVVAGGQLQPASYHTDVEPYYWDVFMDGTRAARMVAEYWCKRLEGKRVRWGGLSVQDPDTNPVTPPPERKLGIVYFVNGGSPVVRLSVDLLVDLVTGGMCGSAATEVGRYEYASDISSAQQQSSTTAAAVKKDKITTLVCVCDPIAPAFLTVALDEQRWEPEHLLAGTGLIDYDLLGRLYSKPQWAHAFGLSHLQLSFPFEQTDAARAWRDAGNQGSPGDKTSNLTWAYFSLMGASFHYAGPNPTPENIRHGLFVAPERGGWEESGGDPHYPLIDFGETPDDYTGIGDAREVFWNETRTSEIDGRPGSYEPVDGGRRYRLGAWPTGDPEVFR